MKPRFGRREFLAGSGRIAAGLAAASLAGATIAAEGQTGLILACRDAQLAGTGKKDCWTALESIGATGVDATVADDLSFKGLFHPERQYSIATPAGIDMLMADMNAAGKRITAISMANAFDTRPEFEAQWVTKVAQAAQAMGVKAIRIDLAARKLSANEFLDFSVKILKRIIAATDSTGVALGIENHGKITNNPEFLEPLFERVGSDRLGLTLDTGNFYWFGHPLSKVYAMFERFAPRVKHTHCKNIRYPEDQREKQRPTGWEYAKYNCPLYEGDIDYGRVVKILRAANYSNDLCVEDESLGKQPAENRGDILAREIALLKKSL